MHFNLLSTGVGRSMWDWLISHMTPCGTLSRRSMPQANARLPWLFTAEVSLSSSYYPAAFCRHSSVLCQPKQTLTVYTERPLILFLLLLRFLVSPADYPFPAPIVLIAGKYFIAKLIPLYHSEKSPKICRIFCVPKDTLSYDYDFSEHHHTAMNLSRYMSCP